MDPIPDDLAKKKGEAEDTAGSSAADEHQLLREKLADEIRLRKFTEQVLDARQKELQSREKDTQDLTRKVASLKKKLAETQAELVQSQERVQTAEQRFEEAKDQIFRLQPQRNCITETEAIEKFKHMCSSVQRWVENRMQGVLDDLEHGRLRSRASPVQSSRLLALMRDAAKPCIDVEQSDEHHVTAIIMHCLWLTFFAKSFYCPLDDTDNDASLVWINDLSSSMSRAGKDLEQCREWRNGTIVAMTVQQAFKTRRAKYVGLISDDLAQLLSGVVPNIPLAELSSSLRRSIVEPAADLAHQLHLAPDIYTLRWTAKNPWTRLEVYDCINLSSGSLVLNLTSSGQNSPMSRKLSYLFDVAPGLFIERIREGKKSAHKAICRPTVLVHVGKGEVSQKRTIMRWLWECSVQVQPSDARDYPQRTSTPQRPFNSMPPPPPPGRGR